MKAHLIAAIVGMLIAPVQPALAQSMTPRTPHARSGETLRSLRIAERNQLGLLEYCRDQGLVSQAVVAGQRKFLRSLPPPEDDQIGAAEEAAGRKGMIAFGGDQTSLAVDATAQGISISYSCDQMAMRAAAHAMDAP